MTNEQKYKTPEERAEAFLKFCTPQKCDECECTKLGKMGLSLCEFRWLALEAEEELLPCPFCGGDAEIESIPSFRNSNFVRCKICLSSIRGYDTKDKAVAAWNRRAK